MRKDRPGRKGVDTFLPGKKRYHSAAHALLHGGDVVLFQAVA